METTQKLDAKQELLNQFDMYAYLFNLDLDALSEVDAMKSYGGCTRSGVAVMAECAGFNKLIDSILKGTDAPQLDHLRDYEAQGTSKEKAKQMLAESLDEIKSTIQGLSEEALGEAVMAPWGQEMSRYGLASIAAAHLWYHNGQVAYMQALNGDSKNYWMPG